MHHLSLCIFVLVLIQIGLANSQNTCDDWRKTNLPPKENWYKTQSGSSGLTFDPFDSKATEAQPDLVTSYSYCSNLSGSLYAHSDVEVFKTEDGRWWSFGRPKITRAVNTTEYLVVFLETLDPDQMAAVGAAVLGQSEVQLMRPKKFTCAVCVQGKEMDTVTLDGESQAFLTAPFLVAFNTSGKVGGDVADGFRSMITYQKDWLPTLTCTLTAEHGDKTFVRKYVFFWEDYSVF